MCGVPLSGRTIGYSEIAPVAVLSEAMRSTPLLFSVNQSNAPSPARPYGFEFAVGVWKSRYACVDGSNDPTAETRCSVYQMRSPTKVRSQGPLPGVTGHCPTNWRLVGLNSPIMLLFGVVNQRFPDRSKARKIGWLPGRLGSV